MEEWIKRKEKGYLIYKILLVKSGFGNENGMFKKREGVLFD